MSLLSDKKGLMHSVFASLIMIFVFILMAYIVVPVFFKFMAWYGFYFVPERMGGGSEIGNEGIIQLTFRAIVSIVVSAGAGFYAGRHFFPNQNTKLTFISAGAIIITCIGTFIFITQQQPPTKIVAQEAPKAPLAQMAQEAPKAPLAQLPMSSAKGPFISQPAVIPSTPIAPPTILSNQPQEHKAAATKPRISIKKIVLSDGSWFKCRDAVRIGNTIRVETELRDLIEFDATEVNVKKTFARR